MQEPAWASGKSGAQTWRRRRLGTTTRSHSEPVLVRPKCPSNGRRDTLTLAGSTCARSPQPALMQNRPASPCTLRRGSQQTPETNRPSADGPGVSRPGRQVCRGPPPSRARWAGRPGPYERVDSPSTALGHQVLDEHGREEEVVRRSGQQVEVGSAVRRPRRPASHGAQQWSRVQTLQQCEQFRDVARLVPLRRRQLAPFVSPRVLMALVVRLSQAHRDCYVIAYVVRTQDRLPQCGPDRRSTAPAPRRRPALARRSPSVPPGTL